MCPLNNVSQYTVLTASPCASHSPLIPPLSHSSSSSLTDDTEVILRRRRPAVDLPTADATEVAKFLQYLHDGDLLEGQVFGGSVL